MMRSDLNLKIANIKTKRNETINSSPNNIFRLMVSEEKSMFFKAWGKKWFCIKATGGRKMNFVIRY
jgi:hypothetical protein